MNKNQINGKMTQIKGQVKELVGKAVGNPTMEMKGKATKVAGKAQAKLGDVTQAIKNKL
jgi:uncharacterized protein YjbJ (UPF0337 family)